MKPESKERKRRRPRIKAPKGRKVYGVVYLNDLQYAEPMNNKYDREKSEGGGTNDFTQNIR